jgi:ATP-binding cassette subfamily B multidrug efflux pump
MTMAMFTWFERIVDPTRASGNGVPPASIVNFYWHFARQARVLFISLFVVGFAVAVLDSLIPALIGRVVALAASTHASILFSSTIQELLGMALVLLVLRPAAMTLQNLIMHQAINANVMNLIRWQSHSHVDRQPLAFFQNDFAGRIANHVIQTGPAMRESLVALITVVWYILVYGISALVLLAEANPWLSLPLAIWFVVYLTLLRVFTPRLLARSEERSRARSILTGCIVDRYANMLTAKLFPRLNSDDVRVRDALKSDTGTSHAVLRLYTVFSLCLTMLNALMTVTIAGVSTYLCVTGHIGVGAVAMALPLAWQIANISGSIALQVTHIFENVGIVQEGMHTIAKPAEPTDRPDAAPLVVSRGEIRFEDVQFGYNREEPVIDHITLVVRAGEKLGLIGPSGSGKSTLVHLLMRLYTLQAGRIVIDGHDMASMTEASLRDSISLVTQDTSLLHRSIRDNIGYGRPGASEEEIVAAAKLAAADDFILTLKDWEGRRGYDAHVGERGVTLSGGQRQQIAIARVILKDAPILVLDEATSALDTEVEAAIQSNLANLAGSKTVITIAHRLSTIARVDRLVLMRRGRIVEQGTHEDLLHRNEHYAALWQQSRRQSRRLRSSAGE